MLHLPRAVIRSLLASVVHLAADAIEPLQHRGFLIAGAGMELDTILGMTTCVFGRRAPWLVPASLSGHGRADATSEGILMNPRSTSQPSESDSRLIEPAQTLSTDRLRARVVVVRAKVLATRR
jgi:hypothetical protein